MADSQYWDRIWNEQPAMRVNNFARRAYRRIQAAGLSTLLDLGCGTGQDALFFSRRGLRVTALDIAPAGLERLRRLDPRISCLQQDFCGLAMEEGAYQVVYAHLSLQYFDDQQTRRVFASILHVLAPGGLFFVKCKSTADRLYGQGEAAGRDTFIYHHLRHFFTREYMRDLLAPFNVLSLRRTSSVYARHPSAFIEAVAGKSPAEKPRR